MYPKSANGCEGHIRLKKAYKKTSWAVTFGYFWSFKSNIRTNLKMPDRTSLTLRLGHDIKTTTESSLDCAKQSSRDLLCFKTNLKMPSLATLKFRSRHDIFFTPKCRARNDIIYPLKAMTIIKNNNRDLCFLAFFDRRLSFYVPKVSQRMWRAHPVEKSVKKNILSGSFWLLFAAKK